MARKPHVAYSVSWASAGCMPDSTSGPYTVTTRRELADLIRSELEAYDLPASLFRTVGLRRLWGLIVNAGSASSMHFSFQDPREHSLYALHFEGLTQLEAESMAAEWEADQ